MKVLRVFELEQFLDWAHIINVLRSPNNCFHPGEPYQLKLLNNILCFRYSIKNHDFKFSLELYSDAEKED